MDKSVRLSRRRAKSASSEVVQNVKFRASFLKKKFVLYLTKIMFYVEVLCKPGNLTANATER